LIFLAVNLYIYIGIKENLLCLGGTAPASPLVPSLLLGRPRYVYYVRIYMLLCIQYGTRTGNNAR
jgi:hypothetical protein